MGLDSGKLENENWNLKLTDDQLATLYFDYCTAMKKVDPTIKIMASCKNSGISVIIQKCGSLIDILDVGSYPCYEWGSYDYFSTHPDNDLIGSSDIQARTQGGRKVVMYEFNAVDWSGSFGSQKTWPNTNDLGHGMVIFEMIGQLLTNNNIAYGNFWTTRWADEKGNYNVYYALDKNNQILPVAKPLVVWGKFIKDTLVNISHTGSIITYAAFDPNSGNLNLFLSNKATSSQNVSMDITSTNNYKTGEEWQLKGTGPADISPIWGKVGAVTISNNKLIDLKLPAISITVVSISK